MGKWLAVLALLWAMPANAVWYEARGPHFIVYADGSAASVERTARQLEQFDAVLRRLQKVDDPPEIRSNPVTVYVTPSVSTVQRLCGNCPNVWGFYRPMVSGSTAFTPRSAPGGDGANAMTPRIVLFHEYGHHFLLGTYASAYPAWFSEGYAEFVSTAAFDKDSVMIGGAAQHRAYDLFYGNRLPTRALFASTTRKMNEGDVAALYARGWLLTHFITFDAARGRQFDDYVKRLNAGEPSLDAATHAFGDLRQLDRDLDHYLDRSHLTGINVKLSALPEAKIAVRSLTPGQEAMIGLRMESDAGVDDKEAPLVYRRAAAIASRYPDDAMVQGWFAEMAYDAGHDDEADAAAGKALAVDPKDLQALLYRGRAHLRRAIAAHDNAGIAEARTWFIKANRADNNNAEALYLFYRSFPDAGEEPRKSAIAGLDRAMQLVPQDPEVRVALARQAIIDGDTATAKLALRPIAYSPHGDDVGSAVANRLLALVESGVKGKEALAAFDAETERLAKARGTAK